jgi:hypothetical protein
MSENHQIIGDGIGEPLPAGRVGVRVRVQLSGCPSGRWSRALSAHLCGEFAGHPAVGHLRLDDAVQGDYIVLDGVEAAEAPRLADAVRGAVDATNRSLSREPDPTANMAQETADAIAGQIDFGSRPS